MVTESETQRLLEIMAALRHPRTGCPWDQLQDFDSIAPYTIEEAYEVADAIARRDHAALPDELGDLLLQVVYHSRIAEEAGMFRYEDVVRSICDKMIRRHPHVFGDTALREGAWEDAKAVERSDPGALAGVPANLPALTRADKLGSRAARVGFDWPDIAQAVEKLDEEVRELGDELADADPARLADELGDVLFSVANVARKLGLDPETCLRHANAKFTRRFAGMEQAIEQGGRSLPEATLGEMEAAWQDVKRRE